MSFYSISMERIIESSEETKKIIQNALEQGLLNGTVKPFERCVLTGSCTGMQVLETLE